MISGDDSVVDWNDLHGWAARLDPSRRDQLADTLRDAQHAVYEKVMVDTVRDILAHMQLTNTAVRVVFATEEWDNGYFLSAAGTVVFADGSTDQLEFDDLDHVFTDAIGVRGATFGLSVDIRTGQVDTDDYVENLHLSRSSTPSTPSTHTEPPTEQVTTQSHQRARNFAQPVRK